MKTFLAVIVSLGLAAGIASAQPTIAQISNAASASLSVPVPPIGSGDWATLPNGAIAQGSYFSIYGNGLAADVSTCGAGYANCIWPPHFPLPTQIQGTQVSITIGTNAPVLAFIEFAAQVTPTLAQINAVLPSVTPVGSGTVTVTYNGLMSAPAPITVVPSSFGAFALSQAGSGPGTITDANYNAITPFHTATPSQALILWGTGLGPAPDPSTEQTAGPCPSGCDLRGPLLSVTVWVGNQQANVAYAGRAPGYTAEDEVVFTVPSAVTAGCYVSVAVQTGPPGGTQVTSNFTSLAVDPNGAPCNDADGVNMNDIASAVQSKGSANVASIGLLSQIWYVNLDQDVFVQWINDTVAAPIGTFGSVALNTFSGFTETPSVDSCSASAFLGYPPPIDYGLGYAIYLDAGPALNIQGPVSSQAVNQTAAGYNGLVGGATTANGGVGAQQGTTPFYWLSTAAGGPFNITGLATGNYMVTAPGGKDVSAFSGTIDVPAAAGAFVWTNESTFDNQVSTPVIPRDTPLNITWTGGDPQGFVDIALMGSTTVFTFPDTNPSYPEPGVYIQCIVPAGAGSFNVPSYVLQALPPSLSGSALPGLVLVGPASAVTKMSPLPAGLDAAYLYYRFLTAYTVQWQ